MRARIRGEGFAFAPAARMAAALGELRDWPAFVAGWDGMPLDTQLPEGHRYRRRRHATLSVAQGASGFRVEAHQPHYQALDYNPLVGGIERWFEPMAPATLASATFQSILGFCAELFGELRPEADWHVECHQFRIEARAEAAGLPTPEGVHRD
ncbi:MAG TPA: 2OG-Fe dioxygenase family protein, partial [Usitatibacter sp.]|nr:2OG-Fe dioxygenase family protein [Usitatibacter sp.]